MTEIQRVFQDRRVPIRDAAPDFDSDNQTAQVGLAQLEACLRHMLSKEASDPLQHTPGDYLGELHSGRLDAAMREEACLTVL